MTEITLHVTGMHCPNCVKKVEQGVGALSGVASVKADHEADTVVLRYDGDEAVLAAVRTVIQDAGFVVEGILPPESSAPEEEA